MITCEVLVVYDDHSSLYVIGQDTVEKCLRAETAQQANDLIVDKGLRFEQVRWDDVGDVMLNMIGPDDMSFGEFQNALMEFAEDVGV